MVLDWSGVPLGRIREVACKSNLTELARSAGRSCKAAWQALRPVASGDMGLSSATAKHNRLP